MATGGGANLTLGGGDPRLSLKGDEKEGGLGGEGITGYTRAQLRAVRDPNVSFEEYQYWAAEARKEEDETAGNEAKVGIIGMLFPSKNNQSIAQEYPNRRNSASIGMPHDEKDGGLYSEVSRADVSDDEWINAQRALRTTSGAAVFYLITTDILGPFGLPYSFGTVGWVPGIVLFTIFAVLAGYSGFLMNRMFLGVDSFRYPAKAYGDVAYRIYGQWGRIPVNLLQGLQLILTVSLITISNGQALSVITKFKLCYVVCIVILVAVGGVVGQIRTLQKFGWLANVAVFMNVFIMILTMAVAATSPPNYPAVPGLSSAAALGDGSADIMKNGKYPPVIHHTGIPSTGNFDGALNGIMNTVFAYGGANIFNEFMAEMKRPRDFLKAMWAAQFFIWIVYMFYGLFMYAYQGQYSVNPSPQTVSPYWALVVANIFYILSASIAATLYGNIGLKVIYNNIFVEIFRAPPLVTKAGKIIWVIMIPLYWIIAFCIGAAIPDFGALVGVVGAICIVQFTYSFPPLFHIGYILQSRAILPSEEYNPATGKAPREGGFMARMTRGFARQTALEKAFFCWNWIYMLAAFALGGLGAYASFEGIIGAFTEPQVNAFSCSSPLDFEAIS